MKWLSDFYHSHLGPGSFNYGILSFCRRCVFGGRYETIMIYSLSKNHVIVIQNYKKHHYIRKGKCLGYCKCPLENKCFDKIDNDKLEVPCRWIKV